MTDADIERLAAELREAERSRAPIEPLTDRHPELTLPEAYRIQDTVIGWRRAAGARLAGRKIGLTSAAMQRMLGVDTPDYGQLLDDMVLPSGAEVEVARLIQPRAEPEIAFVLREPLRGPGVTALHVLAATRFVLPAIEVIDSRVRDWRIRLCDTVADNGSSARAVLGPQVTVPSGFDLALTGAVLERNGEVVATAAGAAVLGHPAASVAWLANALAAFGAGVEPGEVILSGSLTAAVPLAAGDRIAVRLDRLGSVELRAS